MWGLDIAANEFEAELKAAGLKLDRKNAVLVTREKAIKFRIGEKTDYYRKIMRDEINRVKAAEVAKIAARQTTMFELTEGTNESNHNNRRQHPGNGSH